MGYLREIPMLRAIADHNDFKVRNVNKRCQDELGKGNFVALTLLAIDTVAYSKEPHNGHHGQHWSGIVHYAVVVLTPAVSESN